MSFLSNIFSKGASDLVDEVGKVMDTVITSDDEKLKAKEALTKIVLNSLNSLQDAQRDVILAEAKGNWLQRSWRPILMLGFGFIVMYAKFIGPAIGLEVPELERSFWVLLELGIGGYVIGRSTEKITDKVTKNIDIPFLRKKDRKDKIV